MFTTIAGFLTSWKFESEGTSKLLARPHRHVPDASRGPERTHPGSSGLAHHDDHSRDDGPTRAFTWAAPRTTPQCPRRRRAIAAVYTGGRELAGQGGPRSRGPTRRSPWRTRCTAEVDARGHPRSADQPPDPPSRPDDRAHAAGRPRRARHLRPRARGVGGDGSSSPRDLGPYLAWTRQSTLYWLTGVPGRLFFIYHI